MRVWRGTGHGYDQVRTLATANLPRFPAALPLFDRAGHARTLGLDFDTSRHGRGQVLTDIADATTLFAELGAEVIADRAPGGGHHLWVPLWASHRIDTLAPLLAAMRRRWPSLDPAPMSNPVAGCLTGPGSPCIDGGHRELLTPLDRAVDALRHRSPPGTLARLAAALQPACAPHAPAAPPPKPRPRVPELPSRHARDFAEHGVLPAHRPGWTRSEARQNVLTWAVRCGWTFDDVTSRITCGHWSALADSYAKYTNSASCRLRADWDKAVAWAETVPSPNVRGNPHKQQHTGGAGLQRWLQRARSWTLSHHPGPWAQRLHCLDVLQALAYASSLTGRRVLAVGGRWLSIAAGLLDEHTVWATLRLLRETPGSPVRRVKVHAGRAADVYELVTVDGPTEDSGPATDVHLGIGPVPAVWKLIGRTHRPMLELVDRLGPPGARMPTRHLLAHSDQPRSSAYESLRVLRRWGLIDTGRGWVARTARSLDDIAVEHRVQDIVAARVIRHRAERRTWWDLLAQWHAPAARHCPPAEHLPVDPLPADDHERWLAAVLATGPPTDPYEPSAAERHARHALTLLSDGLGVTTLRRDPIRSAPKPPPAGDRERGLGKWSCPSPPDKDSHRTWPIRRRP